MADKTTADLKREVDLLLKEHNMRLGYYFTFPMYRKLPEDIQLALAILEKHGMHVVIEIQQTS